MMDCPTLNVLLPPRCDLAINNCGLTTGVLVAVGEVSAIAVGDVSTLAVGDGVTTTVSDGVATTVGDGVANPPEPTMMVENDALSLRFTSLGTIKDALLVKLAPALAVRVPVMVIGCNTVPGAIG
ncbi:hypothetical protein KDA_18600 [Dictyobacter alpinus]|uniref:Uncharacterized protein n=1 Tax=Dictyobacter alpinus TaxID=2014873 RepID=A0A402B4V9_9CHLR|nr:hypothetical protein KDA_18600 [Dictyobacter alpinus]